MVTPPSPTTFKTVAYHSNWTTRIIRKRPDHRKNTTQKKVSPTIMDKQSEVLKRDDYVDKLRTGKFELEHQHKKGSEFPRSPMI